MIYGLKCIFIRSGLSDFLSLLMVIFLYIPAIPVLWGGFGQGTGPIFFRNVACHGTESFLLSCSHPEIGSTNYCSHFDDVGVVCQGIGLGGGKFPRIFKWADATSTKWEGQWPREIDSQVTSDTSNLDHYKLFGAHCWLLLLTFAVSCTNSLNCNFCPILFCKT